jgi:Undecaprenyl-phosphate galactose phosphotransferase WbaP
VKGQTDLDDVVEGETATATATATVAAGFGRGRTIRAGVPYVAVAQESQVEERVEAKAGHDAFSRTVGVQYAVQSLMNSLPLLIVDVFTLAATVAVFRFFFQQVGIRVGFDISSGLAPIAIGFVFLNFAMGLYPGVRLSPVEELRRLVVSITCMFAVWTMIVAMHSGGFSFHRSFLIVIYLACLVTLPVARGWLRHVLGRWTRWGLPVLIFGDDPAVVRVYDWLSHNHHLGLRPVGVIADPNALDIGPDDTWYAGPWEKTHEVAVERGAYWAVVVPPESRPAAIASLIADHLYTIPHVHVLSEFTGLPDHWNPQQIDGLTGIHLEQNLMLPLPRFMKRCMDLVASIIGGIILLPLFFYLAVAVKLSSRGPIVYYHERIGINGRRFKAWKFRSMFQNADTMLEHYLEEHPELRDEWERDHKLKYDPRVTKIGKFLRKTSLDELPQLWNVIRGEMSLVGPRPIVEAEIVKYGPYYGLYTMVKPGITGLWQVSGRNKTTYEERVQFDAYYVRNWSPWLDLFLLLRTIRIVLFAKGAY